MIEIIYKSFFIINFILLFIIFLIILNKKQQKRKIEKNLDVVSIFHHIHHYKNGKVKHEVHHCGGEHVKTNPSLNYIITHCKCGKHKIDVKEAIGHNFTNKEILVEFTESCPEGGWHIESGRIKNDN
ncbi:MAG: hypothetical protein KJ566_01795 [Nanoarchaeota archaeon]|nr:hypothetical protein [Nanoarchaeota archaeon]